MAQLEEIQQILSSNKFNYDRAVSICKEVLSNSRIYLMLLKGDTKKNREVIIYQLRKYQRINKQNYVSKQENTDSKLQREIGTGTIDEDKHVFSGEIRPNECKSISPEHRDNYRARNSDDHLLIKAREAQKKLYKKRGHLHGRLHQVDTDPERYKIAKQIIELQDEVEKINDTIESLVEGSVPEEFLFKHVSAEVYKRIEAIKRYIRRYRKKLESSTTAAEQKKFSDFVNKYELELEELKNAEHS